MFQHKNNLFPTQILIKKILDVFLIYRVYPSGDAAASVLHGVVLVANRQTL